MTENSVTVQSVTHELLNDSGWKSLQLARRFLSGPLSRADRIALGAFLTGDELKQRSDYSRRCVRVAVACDASLENLCNPLALRLLERGLFCDFYHAPFAQIAQEVRNPSAGLLQHQPDIVVLAPLTNFSSRRSEDQSVEPGPIVDEAWSHVAALREHFAGLILVANAIPVESRSHGILDSRRQHGAADLARSINLALSQRCRESGAAFVLDAEFLAAQSGVTWPTLNKSYLMASRPFPDELMPRLALDVAAFAAALKGFARKCLALDLDNTLWGGVVGEEGWKGVKLGGAYPANLYVELQREIAKLHDRGVVLALISKNDEADAWEVFSQRAEMVLKRSDISAHRINWNDKASNLRELAAELNLGLDAFVVIDDNPVERAWIEEALPEVEVCPAGDPLEMLRWLTTCGRFDTLAVTNEDALRSKSYAAAEERKKIETGSNNLEEYLTTLQTEVDIGLLSNVQLARVAQLTQKTNQFNLTTRRYSESELNHRMSDPDWRIYWCACRDRFADEGIISVAIVIADKDCWRLDTLLMSCRVLGRGVEKAFLQTICDDAENSGVSQLIGEYISSPKNSQTERFYDSCGCHEVERSTSSSRWSLELPSTTRIAPEGILVTMHNPESTALSRQEPVVA